MSQESYDFGVGEYEHVIRVEVFHHHQQETIREVAIDTLGALFFCCTAIWITIQLLTA